MIFLKKANTNFADTAAIVIYQLDMAYNISRQVFTFREGRIFLYSSMLFRDNFTPVIHLFQKFDCRQWIQAEPDNFLFILNESSLIYHCAISGLACLMLSKIIL